MKIRWLPLFVFCLIAAAAFLRFRHAELIEFKHDEAETIWFLEKFRSGETGWPWLGQLTSNGMRHPGFGIWIFTGIGYLFDVTTPVGLAHIPQGLSVLAMLMLFVFALRWSEEKYRDAWLWATASLATNPYNLLLDRKGWHPSLLPVFIVGFMLAWFHRKTSRVALVFWGLLGALLGQIHMGGYFLTGAVLVWTWFFDEGRDKIRWRYWFLGSSLGAIPIIPWLIWAADSSTTEDGLNFRIHRLFMFKFWNYWARDSFGWNSKWPLGLEVDRFYRWPLIDGQATHLVAIAHYGLILLMLLFIGLLGRTLYHRYKAGGWRGVLQADSDSALFLHACFFGVGAFATLACINIPRYFNLFVYPTPALLLALIFLQLGPKLGKVLLAITVVLQLFISIQFQEYIAGKREPVNGDYGTPLKIRLDP